MISSVRSAVVGVALFGASLCPAMAACVGATVAFMDQFKTLDLAWTTPDGMSTANNHLTLAIPSNTTGVANWANHSLNQNNVYGDGSVCATVRFPSTIDPNFTAVGIAFWGFDDTAYYTFAVSPVGSFSLQRKVANNRFIYPISWTNSAAVKKDLNQPQELQVVTKGNVATIFIDGTKLGEITGQPPAGGGLVGLFWELPLGTPPSTVQVDDFQVKN